MGTPKYTVDKKDIDSLFSNENKGFKHWIKNNRVGIYATIIFHLLIFLSLAINKITTLSTQTVYMEFTHQTIEEPEIDIEQEEKEKLEKELDQMLKDMATPNINVPNLAVNAAANGSKTGHGQGGATFFSSKNTSTLRDETKQKQEEEQKQNQGADNVRNINETTEAGEAGEAYKGPSIVSYFLDGRTAISLPIPAYKCLNGGDVTVIIEVNRLGYVIGIEIDTKNSSRDECLHTAAKMAAEKARFTSSNGANSQKGNIVYRFVPQ